MLCTQLDSLEPRLVEECVTLESSICPFPLMQKLKASHLVVRRVDGRTFSFNPTCDLLAKVCQGLNSNF